MDPLSISASVIAVTGLAASITKALHQLRLDYVELPGRLLALKNEVADLEIILTELDTLLSEKACWSTDEEVALPGILERAETRLADLHRILECLSAKHNYSQILRRATVWRKWQPKLQNLQNDLREIKASLNVLLGASHSRDMLRMRIDLEAVSRTTSHESAEQSDFRDKLTTDLQSQHTLLTGVVSEFGTNIDQRLSKIEALLTEQYGKIPVRSDHTTRFLPSPVVDMASLSLATKSEASPFEVGHISPSVNFHVRRQVGPSCPTICVCCCHIPQKASSQGYLDRFLGQLFLGYAGVPLVSAKCDYEQCRNRQNTSISVEYWFPIGLCWSQILHMDLAYHRSLGPQWQLKTMRRVPDSALCVKYALEGNSDGLKDLFHRGLASPRDVSSTRGYTLLRWALYGQKYETCRFLLTVGSDPDYKPIAVSDDCPSDKACDIILRGNISPEVEEIMRFMSRGNDFIDNQNFSQIHKIVLGLSFSDLETEILRDPLQVDVTDIMGRTPLEWAAARGDSRAIVTLLSFGANPNIMDRKLNTPLTLASNQGHTTAVRLLLEAGASPDPVLPTGVKFGTPLNCASRNATDPALVKTLLDFDANVEACGVDGVTPLLHVARSKPSSFARLLLDYGANINAASKDGRTALTTSIVHNNHGVLRLLLDRWFEYTACPRLQGPHLLELAAQHADMETISILINAKHLQLRRDKYYASEREKFKIQLRERVDASEELIASFDTLLDAIVSEENATRNPRWWPQISTNNSSTFEKKDVEASVQEMKDLESPQDEFVDASENFMLATDDLPTLLRRRLQQPLIDT